MNRTNKTGKYVGANGKKPLSLRRNMNRLRYIVMIVLSLLVIYSGVGVSVCSCLTCEVACMVCSTPCSGCEHDDDNSDAGCAADAEATCQDEGCSIDIYKVNLAQQSAQSPVVSIPSFELFCGLLPHFQSLLPVGETKIPYVVPPPKDGSRQMLVLHSTLLI